LECVFSLIFKVGANTTTEFPAEFPTLGWNSSLECVFSLIFKVGANMVMTYPKVVSKKVGSREEEVVSSMIGIGRL